MGRESENFCLNHLYMKNVCKNGDTVGKLILGFPSDNFIVN